MAEKRLKKLRRTVLGRTTAGRLTRAAGLAGIVVGGGYLASRKSSPGSSSSARGVATGSSVKPRIRTKASTEAYLEERYEKLRAMASGEVPGMSVQGMRKAHDRAGQAGRRYLQHRNFVPPTLRGQERRKGPVQRPTTPTRRKKRRN